MSNQVLLSLGANLGNRQGNILQALQYIRARADINGISSFYETEPVGYLEQPKFINIACSLETELPPRELLSFLKWIEKRVGRRETFRNGPRSIDLDIIFYDDLVIDDDGLTIPHPRLQERAFVLLPLAEIAAEKIHPVLKTSVAELLKKIDHSGVQRLKRSLRLRLDQDRQQSKPTVPISLSRVGITNLQRIIRIEDKGRGNLFHAHLELFADLNPKQAGMHMSRFSDVLEELVEEISLQASPDIESLAERLAKQVIKSQKAVRSEVRIRAYSSIARVTPVSAKRSKEVYTLIGMAASSPRETRHLVGVEAEGMTVCPCAQDMVKNYSRELLQEEGFSGSEISRILNILPIASHNQRGRGTLLLGTTRNIRAENLLHIIEASMSSETYELLKREDEFFVVNKAHRNPRFVEDVVREIIRNVVEIYPDLPDEAFVLAKQENFEGIHKHNAFAEHFGTMAELRQEVLTGRKSVHHTTLEEWLNV